MSKIVFFGTSEFAVPILDALVKNGLAPSAIVTSPDRPAGRGKKLISSPVKEFLTSPPERDNISFSLPLLRKERGLGGEVVLFQPEKLDSQFISKQKELGAELGIVASYGKILPKELIDIFPKGILNIHPSLLPKYRGASPIQQAILNGDAETGVSIILLDEKMDHGPVLAKREFPIFNSQFSVTYTQLHDSLAGLGSELLIETIPKWLNGEIIPHPQDDAAATFTKLIKKEDGKIDWSKNAVEIERMVRAFYPWPGVYMIANGAVLKIKKAEIINLGFRGLRKKPGEFFEIGGFPAVQCGQGELKLLVVQPEGKKDMSGDAFLHGNKNFFAK